MEKHPGYDWNIVEDEVRQRSAGPGVWSMEALREFSGLEQIQKMLAGELPYSPIADTLGFMLVEAEKGRVVFQGRPSHQHYNLMGVVHGGYHATLLDSCVASAIHSMLEAGQGSTTLELKVNYIRALTERTGPVRAEGKVIHVGRQSATAEGRLLDAEGRLYAHATTTCHIFTV